MKRLLRKLAKPFGRSSSPANASQSAETNQNPPNPQFKTERPRVWENDIASFNDLRLDKRPFQNLCPPDQLPREAFDIRSDLTEELLGGTSLEQFVARDTYPMPHVKDREGYQVKHDARYFLNGLADYLKVLAAANRYDVSLDSIFDFGCASGRVLRQFCAQSEITDLWGCDINGRHIAWMNRFLPVQLKTFHSHAIPVLPMASNSMDVISAFSVFTHIDTFETTWLAELYRILKPGGMVYFTAHNNSTWKRLQSANGQPDFGGDFLLKRLTEIRPDISDLLQNELPVGRTDFRYSAIGPYRAVVIHHDDYLRSTWGRYFEVQEIQAGGHGGGEQAVFIGIKR